MNKIPYTRDPYHQFKTAILSAVDNVTKTYNPEGLVALTYIRDYINYELEQWEKEDKNETTS